MSDNKNDMEEFYNRLTQLYDEGKTKEEILKILMEAFQEKLSEDFISGNIQHFLSEKNKAENLSNFQTTIFGDSLGEHDNEKHGSEKSEGKPVKSLVTLSKRFDDFYNLIADMNRNLKEANKRIGSLETKTGKIEELIKEIDKNNPYEKIDIRSDEMIKIYASERNKKSVNINTQVNQRIMDIIYKKYGIENNNSLAVNTALLLALYKSGLEDMKDYEKNEDTPPTKKTSKSKSSKRKTPKSE